MSNLAKKKGYLDQKRFHYLTEQGWLLCVGGRV
jgi:hypothetical protein